MTPLYCEVDGNFPNHHPDPSKPENLQDLIAAVRDSDAELGLAFDGDGDRLGVVTKRGHIIYPDRQLMLFADDVLKRNPGAEIIYDVKCTRRLASWITERGGKPLMWKTGHSLVKAKMKERHSPLAGEMSGHIFFGERWYGFDDAQYVGARLLEILSRSADPDAVLDALPDSINTPELNWKLAEGEPHRLIEALQQSARFPGAREIIKLDGLRVEYADGFGLARASNTTPVIVLRFEGDTQGAIERIQAEFRAVLQRGQARRATAFLDAQAYCRSKDRSHGTRSVYRRTGPSRTRAAGRAHQGRARQAARPVQGAAAQPGGDGGLARPVHRDPAEDQARRALSRARDPARGRPQRRRLRIPGASAVRAEGRRHARSRSPRSRPGRCRRCSMRPSARCSPTPTP